MRKIISIALLMCAVSVTAMSQTTTKPKWAEMDDFHGIMAATFHPSEEGNLLPIKTRSEELVTKAKEWQKSTAPAGYDKAAIKATLKKLVNGAYELDKLVKSNATDKVLTEKLSALHDVFHEIMEKCNKEDHH
ncbi:MAG: hypothetical protein ABI480_10800 [Chitinophagaceae bacterium]